MSIQTDIKKLNSLVLQKNLVIDNDIYKKISNGILEKIQDKIDDIIPKLNKNMITPELVSVLSIAWKDINHKYSQAFTFNDNFLFLATEYYELCIVCINEKLPESIRKPYSDFIVSWRTSQINGNG